jgi:hypothetical protein
MKKSAQQRGHSDHAWSKAVERCKYRECSGDPVMPGSIETEFPMHLANDHGAPSIGVKDTPSYSKLAPCSSSQDDHVGKRMYHHDFVSLVLLAVLHVAVRDRAQMDLVAR